jgi:Uma2 family endonuclease
MARAPSKPRATYGDVLDAPDALIAEVVDGDLYTSPRPAPRHSQASIAVATELNGPFHLGRGGPGGWLILFEPELHLGEDILVPDLAAWKRDRLPEAPDQAYIDVAPDWVCEVLSPSTESLDRARKLPLYASQGVEHAWLVNPATRTLEVYRRQADAWLLLLTAAEDARVRAEPFGAVELDLSLIWGRAPA